MTLRTGSGGLLTHAPTLLDSGGNPITFTEVKARTNLWSWPSFELTAAGGAPVLTNLCTDPSREAGLVGWSTNSGAIATVADDTSVFHSGTRSRVSTNVSGNTLISIYNAGGMPTPMTVGNWSTASVWVMTNETGAGGYVQISFLNAVSGIVQNVNGTVATTPPGVWTKLIVSAVAPALTTQARLSIFTSKVGATPGMKSWADDATFTIGVSTETFNGSTVSTDPDFTYAWTGAVGASTSGKYPVLRVGGYVGGNADMVSSTRWHKHGTRSARFGSTYAVANGGGYLAVGNNTGGAGFLLVNGKTYTISATVYVDPADPFGPIVGNVAGIQAGSLAGSWTYNNAFLEAGFTGERRLVVPFTTGVGATSAYVRLLNGHIQGGPSIYVDDVVLEEGTTDGSYFDGSTPPDVDHTVAWTGAANASTSIASP